MNDSSSRVRRLGFGIYVNHADFRRCGYLSEARGGPPSSTIEASMKEARTWQTMDEALTYIESQGWTHSTIVIVGKTTAYPCEVYS